MSPARLVQKIRPIELGEFVKRVCGITYAEHVVGDLRLWLDPASNYGGRLLAEGNYEPQMSKAIECLLRPGDVFVDAGANEGWFSLLGARRVGEEGRVFAIEPQARLWPVLLRNFSMNRIHNVSLLPYAVGAAEGEVELALHPTINTGATSAVIDRRRRHFKRQKAILCTLDRLALNYRWRSVRVLKIDVEGYELEVLRGAAELLKQRKIEHLLIEIHAAQIRSMGGRQEEVSEILTNHGYRAMPDHADCWTSLF